MTIERTSGILEQQADAGEPAGSVGTVAEQPLTYLQQCPTTCTDAICGNGCSSRRELGPEATLGEQNEIVDRASELLSLGRVGKLRRSQRELITGSRICPACERSVQLESAPTDPDSKRKVLLGVVWITAKRK